MGAKAIEDGSNPFSEKVSALSAIIDRAQKTKFNIQLFVLWQGGENKIPEINRTLDDLQAFNASGLVGWDITEPLASAVDDLIHYREGPSPRLPRVLPTTQLSGTRRSSFPSGIRRTDLFLPKQRTRSPLVPRDRKAPGPKQGIYIYILLLLCLEG